MLRSRTMRVMKRSSVGASTARAVGGEHLRGGPGGLLDLEVAPRGDHGHPVDREHREEGLVGLARGDLGGRVDGGLDRPHLARDDEAPPGDVADGADEVGEVGVLEVEGDARARRERLVLHARVELVHVGALPAARCTDPMPGAGRHPLRGPVRAVAAVGRRAAGAVRGRGRRRGARGGRRVARARFPRARGGERSRGRRVVRRGRGCAAAAAAGARTAARRQRRARGAEEGGAMCRRVMEGLSGCGSRCSRAGRCG
jgi:hypothetical protein